MATIGIDIGGTKVLGVRVEGRDVVERRLALVDRHPPDRAALAMIESLWRDDVVTVGVGLAGLVRWPEGVFAWGPHVAGTNVDVRAELEEKLGIPVVVDNDANGAAWAELNVGAAQGYDDFLMVTLGTGIGGSIVIGGQIYRGGSFAGEWGHMPYDPGGILCDCGKSGCWETVASGPALVRMAREMLTINPDSSFTERLESVDLTGEAITSAADAGDEIARGLVAQVGAEFGRGLCGLIAAFDPDLVVVGGGLGSLGESIVGPARRVAADNLHGRAHRLLPPILVAALGPDAGAVGAAMLAQSALDGEILRESP